MVGVNRGWVYMVVGANRGQRAFTAMAKRSEAGKAQSELVSRLLACPPSGNS